MPARITAILLNWRRPDNLLHVVNALATQVAAPLILLWNNGAPISDSRIHWRVDSSVNAHCWPRWLLASMAQTEFVATLDDDLALADELVLSDAIDFLAGQPEDRIIGPMGTILDCAREYRECQHVTAPPTDQPVDIVKGRMMVMRRSGLLKNFRMTPCREDDIAISAMMARGRRQFHLCPGLFHGRLVGLPEPHALCSQPGHFSSREQARRAFCGY